MRAHPLRPGDNNRSPSDKMTSAKKHSQCRQRHCSLLRRGPGINKPALTLGAVAPSLPPQPPLSAFGRGRGWGEQRRAAGRGEPRGRGRRTRARQPMPPRHRSRHGAAGGQRCWAEPVPPAGTPPLPGWRGSPPPRPAALPTRVRGRCPGSLVAGAEAPSSSSPTMPGAPRVLAGGGPSSANAPGRPSSGVGSIAPPGKAREGQGSARGSPRELRGPGTAWPLLQPLATAQRPPVPRPGCPLRIPPGRALSRLLKITAVSLKKGKLKYCSLEQHCPKLLVAPKYKILAIP